MQRRLILTKDGSHTVEIPDMGVTYHSVHGAIQESRHVFINAGLAMFINDPGGSLSIFEMGFGTGLNALLTLIEAGKYGRHIYYHAVEQYPLETDAINSLNYCHQLNDESLNSGFRKLHESEWEVDIQVTPYFTLHKSKTDLLQLKPSALRPFNIIYYDAFAPASQAQLWTKEAFDLMYRLLLPRGILVTYCSKGDVRRAMQAAGFTIEKIPGPPGKREMVRAIAQR